MIHPGRVKNGIHYESPLFDSGKHYTLKVHTSIKDINNNPIEKEYSKTFYITGEDRIKPTPLFENITLPAVGSKQTLHLWGGAKGVVKSIARNRSKNDSVVAGIGHAFATPRPNKSTSIGSILVLV